MRWVLWLVPKSWRETVAADIDAERRHSRRSALWAFAHVVRVSLRLGPMMLLDTVWTDLRYAGRALVRTPAFAFGAMATFAIGIGANVAVFTMVDRMMLRPLPYGNAERLVVLGIFDPGSNVPYGTVRASDVVAVRTRLISVESVAVIGGTVGYQAAPGTPEDLNIPEASSSVFQTLAIQAVLGRPFTADDAREGRRAVLITFEAWRQRFGGRPDILTQSVYRDGEPVAILGVLPEDFFVPPSYWVGRADGIGLDPESESANPPPNALATLPYIRLRQGVSVEAAQAEVDAVLNIAGSKLGTSRYRLTPVRTSMFGREAPATWVVILAGGLILLLCCANLSSLLMLRARARRHQTALQFALGASRGRILRGVLIESLVLASAGAAVALVVVNATHGALRAFVPAVFRVYGLAPTDGRVLAFALLATTLCAVLAALPPALSQSRSLVTALQQGSSRLADGRRRAGALLLGGEALVAVLLVAGAAVTVRNLVQLSRADLGFAAEGLHFLDATYTPYPPDESLRFQQFHEVLEALRDTPGIQRVAAADVLPITGAVGNRFLGPETRSSTWQVTDGYFETMGMPMLAGRTFTADEVRTSAPVGVLSRSAVERLWPGTRVEDALGRTLNVEGILGATVVGVVADVRGDGRGVPVASLYRPVARERFRVLRFVVRFQHGSANPLAEAQRRLNAQGNPVVLTSDPVHQRVERMLSEDRFRAVLFGLFAVFGVTLACVGLYAVTAFEVAQRRVEMGIRLALGATARGLQRHVVRSSLTPVLSGAGAGILLAWWAGKFLQSFLHQVDARDPSTLIGVAALLLLTAMLAAGIPARRASRVDPAVVLRQQ